MQAWLGYHLRSHNGGTQLTDGLDLKVWDSFAHSLYLNGMAARLGSAGLN